MNKRSDGLHPIGVVVERTGLTADVLRVWERRYGVVRPYRDLGGRRLYSDADTERLRLLGRVTAAGRSIGQVAGLSTEDLVELARGDEAARVAARLPPEEERPERFVDAALEQVGALDTAALETLLRRAVSLLGWPVFLEEVVAPLFRRVGDEWHAGRLTPAHEHLASGVIRPLLGNLTIEFGTAAGAPTLVVATPPGERHEIGALLVAAFAALESWKVVYLGPDLPAGEIGRAALQVQARAVALSAVYVEDRRHLLEQLGELRAQLPSDVLMLVGGAAARGMEDELDRLGAIVLEGVRELRSLLRGGGAGHVQPSSVRT